MSIGLVVKNVFYMFILFLNVFYFRFKEREENVKADLFHAYIALLNQTKPIVNIISQVSFSNNVLYSPCVSALEYFIR